MAKNSGLDVKGFSFVTIKFKSIKTMQTSQAAAVTNINVVDSSLSDFYNIVTKLSQIPFVRITAKEDEADCIDWSFTYRKRKFTLQYSIYNGISLFSSEEKIEKLFKKLASRLMLL